MAEKGLRLKAQQRPISFWSYYSWYLKGTLLLYWTIVLIFTPGLQAFVSSQEIPIPNSSTIDHEEGICKSMDIRNTLETFTRLDGCRVVEGFVQILLFDNVNETLLSKISFPELTEITDYLLLYRVNGLRSVGQLFPNLAVIRGQSRFLGQYSMVIFEMSSLQEIGLHSLTQISKGLIRIDKNPALCFVRSIDWEKIALDKGDHFIKSLKPDNECPLCPKYEHIGELNITKLCPQSTIDGLNGYLCWNRLHCQKLCPANCTACNDKGECCNPYCLGGCANNDTTACTVCKDLSVISDTGRQCLTKCPEHSNKYLGRRCLSREACLSMKRPIEINPSDENEYPYKVYNNTCILHCDTNYMNDEENHTCKPCEGKCKKDCPGANVDSVAVAQELKGCTNITGSLEIQIRSGANAVNVLEESLSMIEEIQGYLKVVRSFPLVSLNFFKSLKRIRGKNLENDKYVFVVLDNQNLQDLWDWSNRSLQIDRGALFFHFNPRLCLEKIETLRNKTNLKPFTDLDVAKNSNGDKVACDIKTIDVKISKIQSKGAILRWSPFQLSGDPRQLLGYIVYSIEAPHQNITLYDGRDGCGGDDWRVDDVAKSDEKITHPLVKLKPFTQYAFYVKTYTIASEHTGGQSPIMYFRTLPAQPSVPQNLKVTSNSSDSVKITWLPPVTPNGNITYYIVSGTKNSDRSEINERDYCADRPVETKRIYFHDKSLEKMNNNSCVCSDGKSSKGNPINENEEVMRISFEDKLQNIVYVRRQNKRSIMISEETASMKFENDLHNLAYGEHEQTRYRRDLSDQLKSNEIMSEGDPRFHEMQNITETKIKNVTEKNSDIWESFSFPVYEKTEFFINKLHHFTLYQIMVQACREPIENDENKLCSTTSVNTVKTKKKFGVDDILNIQVTNQSIESVTVMWDQPNDPNGIIYHYSIEYRRVDIENAKSIALCISHRDHKKYLLDKSIVYTIKGLLPGNYSLSVKATTPAGEGAPSPLVYFYIKENSSNTVYLVVSLGILLIVFAIGVLFYVSRKQQKERELRLNPSVNPEYVSSVYVPDEWEVPRDNIKLIKELGQGSFGMVWEGEARDIRGKALIRCAVKTVNEHATNSERMEFLNEASVMKAFDTAHVVRLLGVVSQGQPTLVIMELMANEDLKSYLRSHRPDAENFNPAVRKQPPSLKQIYQMAIEIADGMAYLSAKKFVHRDLAARNCMVAEDLTVKIGDFGMTRDIYETDYYRKGTKGLLPVRWMAPESLRDGVFTSNSDAWSYGVVLWEMATLASQPYQGLANDQVLRYVIDGGVMERPENCPDTLYTLMKLCWRSIPSERPTFLNICSRLLDDASTTFAQVSFYHSAAGIEARTSRPTPSPSQDDQTTPLRRASIAEYDSQDDSDNELGINSTTRLSFPTANGYGCPTNGAATTQC